jgi:two-component system, OmpR family, phosphate regulon sensor histidine kinase PhoR
MGTESTNIVGSVGARARSGRWRVFAISYLCFLLVLAVAGFGLSSSIKAYVKLSLQEEITRNLTQKAQLIANRVNADRAHSIEVIASQEGQAAGARATVIDTNGQVVADSEVRVSSLQNEGRTPEFVAALRGATGTEIRSRNGAEILFVAVPVSGGAVRLACPVSDVETLTRQVEPRVLWGCVLTALAAFALSGAMTWIFQPR